MIVNKCVMASQRTVPRTAACLSRVCLEGMGSLERMDSGLAPDSALFRF